MLKRILLLSVCFYLSNSYGSNLSKLISNLTSANDVNMGVYMKQLDNSKDVVFALHEKRLFIPASIVKLFTAYMALSYLGPNYTFKTTITSDENPNTKKALNSDLFMHFVGDPSFKYTDLVNAFANLNLTHIGGNIILDATLLDNYPTAPGGFAWDDSPFYYAAPKSAIVINKNCTEARMEPSEIGQVAKLSIDQGYLLSVKNTVETVKAREIACPYKAKYLGENNYEVYGCMFRTLERPIRLNFALQDNNLMAKNYILRALDDLNITFTGKIKSNASRAPKLYSLMIRRIWKIYCFQCCKNHAIYHLGQFLSIPQQLSLNPQVQTKKAVFSLKNC